MRIDSAFPSKHLKSADLQGRRPRVRMSHVEMEKIGEDTKPVLYFQGKEKGMVLNKTNTNTIMERFGSETTAWAGHEIELFEADVEFQGRMTKGLRISIPRGGQMAQAPLNHDEMNPPPPQQHAPQQNNYAQARNGQPYDKRMDEEVPF